MQNPYPTIIRDLRDPDHQSVSILPLYHTGDYDRFMKEWKMFIDFQYGYNLAKPGELYWGISEIELKPANAVIQPQVRDINGQLITSYGVVLFNHWSTAAPLSQEHQPRYYEKAVAGWTGNEGSVGWGYAGESWTNPTSISSNPGPYHIWASAHPPNFEPVELRVVGSDCLHHIGWWDDHITPNPVFQIMQKDPVMGPGPSPDTGEYLLGVYDPAGNFVGYAPLVGEPGESGGRIVLIHNNVEVAHTQMISG